MEPQLILHLDVDDASNSPGDWGSWKVITFGQHLNSDEPCALYRTKEPDTVGERPVPADAEFAALVRRKLAHWLEVDGDNNFRLWGDTVFARNVCGVLVWDGEAPPKLKGSRTENARAFLTTYNQWKRGEVFCWQVSTAAGEFVDGCGGCYDVPSMMAEVSALLVKPWTCCTDLTFLLDGTLTREAERLLVREPVGV